MAAPFQNYSGGVLLADIVKRNNLSTYVSEAIKERSAFIKSGAVVRMHFLTHQKVEQEYKFQSLTQSHQLKKF